MKEDVIGDMLETVRFKSAVYFKHGFCGNWGFEVSKGDFAQFHIVSGGHCVLSTGDKTYALSKGDFVIFPRGQPHQIKANPESYCKSGESVLNDISSGQEPFKDYGEIATYLICGHYELDKSVSHFILADLPEVIIIRDNELGSQNFTNHILNLMISELSNKSAGHRTIIVRFAEILFISTLRRYFTSQESSKMNIFNDKAIYESVNYIHKNLSAELPIEVLARQAGISRTSFIERFKNATGSTPLKYIKEWRLTKSKQLLKYSDLSISEISTQIGYLSAASFNHSFKKSFNISPLKYRNLIH